MRIKRFHVIFILCLSCFIVSCQSISENPIVNEKQNSIECTSHDTNKLVNNNIKIENIPFLIYKNTGDDEVTTKLGNWNLKNCSIDINKKNYISKDTEKQPLFWDDKRIILDNNVNLLENINKITETKLIENSQSSTKEFLFLQGFYCEEELSDKKPIYIIHYNNGSFKIDLNEIECLQKFPQVCLANGDIKNDGNTIRLIFTSADLKASPGVGSVITTEYDISKKEIEVKSFKCDNLSFGNTIVLPGTSIISGDRLYM